MPPDQEVSRSRQRAGRADQLTEPSVQPPAGPCFLRLVPKADEGAIDELHSRERTSACRYRLAELGSPEKLILWSLRRWMAGRPHWEAVWREFRGLFDPAEATAALAGLERVVACLKFAARKPWRSHRACCPQVEAVEIALLSAVAACQRLDHGAALAHVVWVVGPNMSAEAARALDVMAQILLRHDFVLMGPRKRED